MRTHAALLILLWGLVLPGASAGEITDAMLDVDPRNQYNTGTGRVYDQAYGPEETPEEEELEAATDLSGYSESLGAAYKGLRSSLYDPQSWPPREELKLLSPDSPDTAQDPGAPRMPPENSGLAY